MKFKNFLTVAVVYGLIIGVGCSGALLKKIDWSWLKRPVAFQWGVTQGPPAQKQPPLRNALLPQKIKTVAIPVNDEKTIRHDQWEAMKAIPRMGPLPVDPARKFTNLKPVLKATPVVHDPKLPGENPVKSQT